MAKLMGNYHSFSPFGLKFHVPALLKTLFRFSASNNEWPDEISKATLEKPKHKRRKKSSFNYNPKGHKLFFMKEEDSN